MTYAIQDFKDGIQYSGALTANTIGPFVLRGGKYGWVSTAASTSQVLSVLMPDGTTYSPVQSETTTAFYVALDLPCGTYEIVLVATGAVQGSLTKIPYQAN